MAILIQFEEKMCLLLIVNFDTTRINGKYMTESKLEGKMAYSCPLY